MLLTEEQIKLLMSKSGVGKRVWFKDKKDGKPVVQGKIVDEVSVRVGDYKHLIQKIECINTRWNQNELYWDRSKYGYRTGYYTYDRNMKHIVWGQYTQFLTEKEYSALLKQARDKGWPI